MRFRFIISVMGVCVVCCGHVQAADKLANWDGTTGNWSDSSKWIITPEPNDPVALPNNGNGGFTYDVDIDSGGVTLDFDAEIEHLLVGDPDGSGRLTIASGHTLTTNAGAELGDSTLVGVVRRGYGAVEITGMGSTWNNTGFLTLGSYGTGDLIISDGGVVNTTSLLAGSGTSIVSPTLRGTGKVTITGENSNLAVANVLNIGNSLGFGRLTADSHASVTAQELQIGSRGALRLEFDSSPQDDAPLAAAGTATLAGSLTANFPEHPAAGTYPILEYQQLDGEFSSITVENLAPSEYSFDYGSGMNDSILLTVAPKPKRASSIYWTDSQNGVVRRANLDGSAMQTIITGLYSSDSPIGIDVDPSAHQIYWGSTNRLRSSGLDGSDVQTVAFLESNGDIAVDHDGGKVYWTIPFSIGASIARANLDGSNVESILNTGSSGVRGIALDQVAGKLYWTNYISNTVNRANLDGSAQETLVGEQSNPMNIALDTANGRMYWSDNGYQQIRSANLDGSDVQTVLNVSSSSGIIDVALDGAGSIYWTQSDCCGSLGQIMRANVDGTNIQEVVRTSDSQIRGLAIVVFDPLPGDYNGDLVVDAADYTVWRNNLGTTFDLNGNGDEGGGSAGTVDEADYAWWMRNYGNTLEMGGGGLAARSTEVPEPAPAILAILAAVSIASAGFQRDRRR